MKKFRDFIYDKNDILIALLILIVAVLIISWRMNAIMNYPRTLFSDTDATTSQQDGETQQNTGTASDAADGSDDQSDSSQNGADGQSATQTDSLWDGDVLARDIEVNVEGSVASAAVGCLIDAGLFADYEEYQTVCDEAGLDDEKVSAGLFVFEKGFTKTDVAAEINWG